MVSIEEKLEFLFHEVFSIFTKWFARKSSKSKQIALKKYQEKKIVMVKTLI